MKGGRGMLREMDFYLVTDSGLSSHGTLFDVVAALREGCSIVQYREKEKSTREMVAEAIQLKELCAGRALFIVNDRLDVAQASEADGVHIGQDDMPFEIARRIMGPGRIIGLTVHDAAEAREAQRLGADYVGLSPIFETGTKKDAGRACGVGVVAEVRRVVSLPIVVIGGITKSNAASAIEAGADAAAAISAVVCADDPAGEVREFRKIINGAKGNTNSGE